MVPLKILLKEIIPLHTNSWTKTKNNRIPNTVNGKDSIICLWVRFIRLSQNQNPHKNDFCFEEKLYFGTNFWKKKIL